MDLINSIEATYEPDTTDEDDVIEAWGIGMGFVIYSRFIFASVVEMMAPMRDLTKASYSGEPFVVDYNQ